METLDYMGRANNAGATLSTVFGVAPHADPYPSTNHYPSGVEYSWGDFVLDERHYDEGRRTAETVDYLVWPRFAVFVGAPVVNSVDLTTVNGHQAGDDWAAVSSDPGFDPDARTCAGTVLEVLEFDSPRGTPESVAVVVTKSESDTVQWIRAPEMIAYGCA